MGHRNWLSGVVGGMQGEEAATQSFHYILISSLIHGSDFPKGQLRFCSAQNGTWGFGSVVKLQPGFAHFGAMSLEPSCLDLLFPRREHAGSAGTCQVQHAEGVPDSWQPAGPTPGPVATGYRMDDSGKPCWTNKLVFSSQQGDDCN